MPVFVIPLLASVAGFGVGLWTGSATGKLLKVFAALMVIYLAWRFYNAKGGGQ
ncbi:hypothetical protein [Vibrio gazogenes]|uniref:hypothetical protein n=1 Tax=Vibrio gazogenes TaxID=687 RepID=UPI0018DF4022|nr:hypothetical protein [Vibrio gazogenes]